LLDNVTSKYTKKINSIFIEDFGKPKFGSKFLRNVKRFLSLLTSFYNKD
jgi:hypothetical protein